jgi:ribosomal protein S2
MNILKFNSNKFAFLSILTLGSSGVHCSKKSLKYSFFREWIFGLRYGKILFNLKYTFLQWKKSIFTLYSILSNRGKFLYLDNLNWKEYSLYLKNFLFFKQFFLNFNYSQGLITNFKYIYFECCKSFFTSIIKKAKIEDNSEGLRNLRRLPNILFVPDIDRNFFVTKEIIRCGIPLVSMIDLDFFVYGALFFIPGNTTYKASIMLYILLILNVCLNSFLKEFTKFFLLLNKKKRLKKKIILLKKNF